MCGQLAESCSLIVKHSDEYMMMIIIINAIYMMQIRKMQQKCH